MSTVECSACGGVGDFYEENMDGTLAVVDCGSCGGYGHLNAMTVTLHTPDADYAVDVVVSELAKTELVDLCHKLNELIPDSKRLQLTVDYSWR